MFACRALGGSVPSRAEFAAAPDVGQHKRPALREPMPADDAQIMRQFRHAEAAVGIHQRRRVRLTVAHVIIRNALAVGRHSVQLPHAQPLRLKLRRLAAHHAPLLPLQIQRIERERRQEAAGRDVQHITAPRLVGKLQHARPFQRQLGHFGRLPLPLLQTPSLKAT